MRGIQTLTWAVALVFCGCYQSMALTPEETQQDIDKLDATWNEVSNGRFQDFDPYQSFSGSIEEVVARYREVFDLYQKAKKAEIEDLEKLLKRFESRYGSTETEIDEKVKTILGQAPQRRTSWYWVELKTALEKVNRFGEAMAAKLLADVQRDLEHIDALSDLIKDQKYVQMEELLEIAHEYDPANKDVKSLLRTIDDQRKASQKAVDARIEGRTWDPHSVRFSGPGKPGRLAKEVEKFLEINDKGDREDTVLAVRIAGDWRVADTTVLGAPLTYGLPVHVAWRLKNDSKTASVQSLTIVTRDAKKAPPFKSTWVGDTWRMRTKAIKSGGHSRSLSMDRSGPGLVYKLLLSSALLLAGLMGIMSWLQATYPKVAEGFEPLNPIRGIIGLAGVGIGLLFLLRNWLHPFSDLIPQLVAIAMGLFLGLELILQASASTKAEAAVKKSEATIRKMGQYQVALGWTCIGLGVFHMLFGGLLFF